MIGGQRRNREIGDIVHRGSKGACNGYLQYIERPEQGKWK